MTTIREAMTTKGVLASLSISCWSGNRMDKQLSDENVQRTGATAQNAIRVHKTLLSDPRVKEPIRIAGEARRLHSELTLPWHYDGVGLLPAAMIQDYDLKMGKLSSAFWEAVNTVERGYGQMIQKALVELGSAFRVEDYPHSSQLRSKYAWATRFERIPTTGVEDLRMELPEEVVDLIRGQIVTEHEVVVKAVVERIAKVVDRVRDRIQARDKDDSARLVQSTFDAFAELPDLVEKLNITGNEDIAEIVLDLREAMVTPEAVKTSAKDRQNAMDDLGSIQRRLKQMMPG